MNSKPLAPKSSPSKSISESKLISKKTRAVIKHKTLKYYEQSHELPRELNLSWCNELVDVSALGGVQKLYLSHCTEIVDYTAVPQAKR